MSWGILRRSNRGERPTQQGDGSEKQIPYREAFQHCAELWDSLPAKCPAVVPDPPPTSKESVWEAKLEHGVVCSYYDLFMRCCIGYAQAHGGAMPDGDCFPCEAPCDCTDVAIGYTSQGMQINEQQNLIVVGAKEGCIYSWAITSGGGELSAGTGTSVIYTAPTSNPECEDNATISLSVGGNTCDTLPIAVNAWGIDTNVAYLKVDDAITKECRPDPVGWTWCQNIIFVRSYNCKDEYISNVTAYGNAGAVWWTAGQCAECYRRRPSDAEILAEALADGYTPGLVVDMRNDPTKAAGCCPAGTL